jgi:hypothetical protein
MASTASDSRDHEPTRLPSISLNANSLCALAASTNRVGYRAYLISTKGRSPQSFPRRRGPCPRPRGVIVMTASASELEEEIAHAISTSPARGDDGILRRKAPDHLPRHLLYRMIAYRLQAERLGDLDRDTRRLLDLIPLRYARRIVMNVEHEARLVGEFLQFYLHSRTRVPFEPPPSA